MTDANPASPLNPPGGTSGGASGALWGSLGSPEFYPDRGHPGGAWGTFCGGSTPSRARYVCTLPESAPCAPCDPRPNGGTTKPDVTPKRPPCDPQPPSGPSRLFLDTPGLVPGPNQDSARGRPCPRFPVQMSSEASYAHLGLSVARSDARGTSLGDSRVGLVQCREQGLLRPGVRLDRRRDPLQRTVRRNPDGPSHAPPHPDGMSRAGGYQASARGRRSTGRPFGSYSRRPPSKSMTGSRRESERGR
jgi:hypothetical protein